MVFRRELSEQLIHRLVAFLDRLRILLLDKQSLTPAGHQLILLATTVACHYPIGKILPACLQRSAAGLRAGYGYRRSVANL